MTMSTAEGKEANIGTVKSNGTKTTSPLSNSGKQQQVAVNDLTPETSGDDDFCKFYIHIQPTTSNSLTTTSFPPTPPHSRFKEELKQTEKWKE
jgi:hypothetical protein